MEPIQPTTDARLAAKQRWAEGSTTDERRRVVCRLRVFPWRDLTIGIVSLVMLALLMAAIAPLLIALVPFVLIGLVVRALLKRGQSHYFYQTPDAAMREYKRVLAGILPADFLTSDGLLRGRDRKPEPICIETAHGLGFGGFKAAMTRLPRWWVYEKGLFTRGKFSGDITANAMRHRVEKQRESLVPEEYAALKALVDEILRRYDSENFIDVHRANAIGTLAHETFHDIQGFLYDNHPAIIDALQQAIDENKAVINAWCEGRSDSQAIHGYRFHHMFPATVDDVPYPPIILVSWIRNLDRMLHRQDISEAAWDSVLIEGFKDSGRLEAIPSLLGAALEGDRGAKAILRDVFASAGLKDDLVRADPSAVPTEEFLSQLATSSPNNESCGSAN